MHRLTRTLALLMLLTSVIQIGGCVTGCDCFALPAGPTALAHSAQIASMGEFLAPLPPPAVACNAQTGIDHPPRS